MERAGLIKSSATNSLRSITAGVLLDVSQTTKKSVIPCCATMSFKYALIFERNPERVTSSLSSNRTALASDSTLDSILRKRRRTLILSNAEGDARAVLSPNNIAPDPGKVTIGLTLA